MKITKEDLINCGVDPSLYNSTDMSVIEQNADLIKDGKLLSLIQDVRTRDPNEESLRNNTVASRTKVIDRIKELSSQLDVIYELCCQKKSIFSSSLSPEETDKILVGSMHAFNKMFELKNYALDSISAMFGFKQQLADIRAEYNQKLYRAGMINAAFAVVCPERDNSDIVTAGAEAFELFNDLTEFINDTNDRIIIFDEALNYKLSSAWNDITILLDFDNDGANLNTQKVRARIESAKQILKDVIER